MKKFLSFFFFVFFAFFAFGKDIVIYHTSDSHGFYYPVDAQGKQTGGFAALKSLVDAEKLPHMLLDSGDFADGNAEANQSKGITSIQLMNAAGYDAITLGNHEFYLKPPQLAALIKKAAMPILAANVYDGKNKNLMDGVQAYKIFNIDGVKVAVVGLAYLEGKGPFNVRSFKGTLKKVLPVVAARKPDVTVLLIHYPFSDARTKGGTDVIAQNFGGKINIILGGHAHKIVDTKVNGVYIFESGKYLEAARRILISVDDKTNKIKSVTSEYIPLDVAKTGEDAKIKELAESLRVPGIDAPLGTAAEDITKSPEPGCADDAASDFVADVMLKNAPGADFSVSNTPGVRTSLRQGPVTEREITALFPFPNKIMLVTADGAFVKKMVLAGAVKDGTSLFAYSGLKVSYKLVNGKAQDLRVTVKGAPLEYDRQYQIAVSDFIASGLGEGWIFKKIPADKKVLAGSAIIPDMIKDEVKKGVPLKAPSVCRIQISQ